MARPVKAAKLQARHDIREARHSGGDVAAAKEAGRAAVGAAKDTRHDTRAAAGASKRAAFNAEHPVIAAKRETHGDVRSAKQLARGAVLTARGSGGDVKAAKAAGRESVTAAVVKRSNTVHAAMADPNSARSERHDRHEAVFQRHQARLQGRANRLA